MPDETGASKPLRAGPGAILRGLAVGALLSGPVVASTTTSGAEPAAVEATTTVEVSTAVEIAPGDDTCQKPGTSAAVVAAIREQFQASFTAGAVGPAESHLTDIVCP